MLRKVMLAALGVGMLMGFPLEGRSYHFPQLHVQKMQTVAFGHDSVLVKVLFRLQVPSPKPPAVMADLFPAQYIIHFAVYDTSGNLIYLSQWTRELESEQSDTFWVAVHLPVGNYYLDCIPTDLPFPAAGVMHFPVHLKRTFIAPVTIQSLQRENEKPFVFQKPKQEEGS